MIKKFLTWLRQKFIYDEFKDVRDFHHKFDQLWYETPGFISPELAMQRYKFLQEELSELFTAMQHHDLAGIADALIDLVYVAKGTAGMYGLPWDKLWDDVQRANMAKVRGTTHRGIAVDVRKPEGWQPPMTEEILLDAGYDGSPLTVDDAFPPVYFRSYNDPSGSHRWLTSEVEQGMSRAGFTSATARYMP